MAKKILTLFLALAMMVTTLSFTAFAQESAVFSDAKAIVEITEADGTVHIEAQPWDGSVAESVDQDDEGTYLISNGAELAKFSVLAKADPTISAKLDSDINMGGQSSSTNWYDREIENYAGTFDGQGHVISNLYIYHKHAANGMVGMFKTNISGTIKNIKFEDALIILSQTTSDKAPISCSVVCGKMGGGTMQNIVVSGTIANGEDGNCHQAGAIVSYLYGGSINSCYSDVEFRINNIAMYTTDNNGIGGIVGRWETGGTITNCGFGGNISVVNANYVGGIVGRIKEDAFSPNGCYSTGDIKGNSAVGGIIGGGKGSNTEVIYANYFTGNVQLLSSSGNASGIATMARRYATSGGTGAIYTVGSVKYVGEEVETPSYKLATVFATGNLQRPVQGGGIFYKNDGDNAGLPAYTTASNYVGKNNAKGYADEYFKGEEIITELNADGVADHDGVDDFAKDIGINGGYPILVWQKDNIFKTAGTYEIASEKNLGIKYGMPVETVAIDVTPLESESVTVVIKDSQGNTLSEKTISGMGEKSEAVFALATACDDITVSTSGRALVEAQTGGALFDNLENEAIKATLTVEASKAGEGVIILALFSGETLEKVNYIDSVSLAEGVNTLSAVIDLSEETIGAGSVLRAFIWEAGTLAPVTSADFELAK